MPVCADSSKCLFKKIINYATALNLMKERFLNAKLQIAAVLWSAVSNPLPCRSSPDTCRCCRIFQDLEDPFVEFLDVLSEIEHRHPNFHRYTTVGPRILLHYTTIILIKVLSIILRNFSSIRSR